MGAALFGRRGHVAKHAKQERKAKRPARRSVQELSGDANFQNLVRQTLEMIAAQMPAELKRARADIIIENDGTFGQLERRVHDVWTALLEEADARRPAVIP